MNDRPEEERVKDVWDLGVFGLGEKRAMDFTQLHQRWLRESVTGYTIERLSSRKLRTAHRDLIWMRYLSDYLARREDRGEQPSALTREDMTAFLSWLRIRVPENNTRNLIVAATHRCVRPQAPRAVRPGRRAHRRWLPALPRGPPGPRAPRPGRAWQGTPTRCARAAA